MLQSQLRLKSGHPDLNRYGPNEMGHSRNALHWPKVGARSCVCMCVSVSVPCASPLGLADGKRTVQLQGKMFTQTQALEVKMKWAFCKKLSITNGTE